ncbi:MAG TPA: RsmE family RNA methyltransferase [Tepidisphaeraceae bacterium]|jgi:16S rRNA (uracil1498-N3)-methyltransferase|nr:RsmE family RNA methyltransferase [Tepidisphaeraceae bacterium]
MRRILVLQAVVGRIDLPPAQAHHLRDVLRMQAEAEIEVFDRAGVTGHARIVAVGVGGVTIQIERVNLPPAGQPKIAIAAAVPKGTRADWMIEKLSELGVDRFIPLATERGVVLPRGEAKKQRWARLAEESARQSERSGIMRIEILTELKTILEEVKSGEMTAWYLSPADDAVPILELAAAIPPVLTLLVGPEGGWSPAEIAAFDAAGVAPVRIAQTILRVETAAIAAAAIVQSVLTLRRSAATIVSDTKRKTI